MAQMIAKAVFFFLPNASAIELYSFESVIIFIWAYDYYSIFETIMFC